MKELNLVICDTDYIYVKNFIKFLNEYYHNYFHCIGITSKGELQKLIFSGKSIDILLINEELINCSISEINMLKLVITLNESERINNIEDKIIFKYQSGHAIFNSIQKIYASTNNGQTFANKQLDTKILSFFSPIGGVGNTTISLMFAINLAKQGKKVLYVNLEYISSLGIYFDVNNNPYSLMDLFYKVSDNVELDKNSLGSFINRNEVTNVYYINPLNSTIDYEEVTIDGVIEIINSIKKYMDFDYVIVDLDVSIKNSLVFLSEYSDRAIGLFTLTNSNVYKIQRYLDEVVNDKKVILLINKHKLGDVNSLRTNNITIDNKLFDYINYDNNLDNKNVNLDTLLNSENINSHINNIINRLSGGN
ncbi:AAA family ATPase [Clostridium sp. MSJ-8]|uniref:AAA family ATPase n=1 Tax=Clostridium sp. MSJ-8 TaxID=2841510 RepID=UPI001C0F0799|nr:AAA family ATPase [Clostridium sp. MSJ-8]MBU5488206.1 AAA family ATPase [Clostridium sp. MSJ-8]